MFVKTGVLNVHGCKPILYLHNKELTTPMNLDEQISKSELCVGEKLKEARTVTCIFIHSEFIFDKC